MSIMKISVEAPQFAVFNAERFKRYGLLLAYRIHDAAEAAIEKLEEAKRSDPSVDKDIAKKVEDEWSQRFPNDILEATIVVVMLAAVTGGAYMMYLLSQA